VARLTVTIGCSLLVLATAAWALRIREFTEAMALAARLYRPRSTNHYPADAP
jgi:hypothetical protein